MSQNSDLGLSFHFIESRKNSRKLPVFLNKIKTTPPKKIGATVPSIQMFLTSVYNFRTGSFIISAIIMFKK